MKVLKKSSLLIIGLFICSAANAGSVYVEKTTSNMNFSSIDVSSQGFSLGYQWDYEKYLPYIEIHSSSDDSVNLGYEAINGGALIVLSTIENLTTGLDLEVGIGTADITSNRNEFDYVTFGAGGFVNYDLTESIDIYLNAKYIYYSESTSNTKCKDGTNSESMGSGTCSSHGGVSFYKDKLGDANGLNFNVGLNISF